MSQTAVRGSSEGRGHRSNTQGTGFICGGLEMLCLPPCSWLSVYRSFNMREPPVVALEQHLNRGHSFIQSMNESPHPVWNVCMLVHCWALVQLHVATTKFVAEHISCSWCQGQIMTRCVTCSFSRPARGVFLHHDRHAAGRGSADLERADQTSGGGGGSSAGSRVGDEHKTHKHWHSCSKWIIDCTRKRGPERWLSNYSLATITRHSKLTSKLWISPHDKEALTRATINTSRVWFCRLFFPLFFFFSKTCHPLPNSPTGLNSVCICINIICVQANNKGYVII